MIKTGLNSISGDSYFIKLNNMENYYLHFNGEGEYEARKGLEGAAIWHKEQGEAFIALSPYTNLELVNIKKVLPNDGTLN